MREHRLLFFFVAYNMMEKPANACIFRERTPKSGKIHK